MTEMPEEQERRRANEARRKAEGESGDKEKKSKIPAHLLERRKAESKKVEESSRANAVIFPAEEETLL